MPERENRAFIFAACVPCDIRIEAATPEEAARKLRGLLGEGRPIAGGISWHGCGGGIEARVFDAGAGSEVAVAPSHIAIEDACLDAPEEL